MFDNLSAIDETLTPIIIGTMRLPTTTILALSFLISFWTLDGFSQTTYDVGLISTEKELNLTFTDKRGIIGDDGVTFLVEQDVQTITAYKGAERKWAVNIIKACGESAVGKPQIRYLKLTGDKIEITFGKHSFASIDIGDGKTKCLGSD